MKKRIVLLATTLALFGVGWLMLKAKKDHHEFMHTKGNIIPYNKLPPLLRHPCYYGLTKGDGSYTIEVDKDCWRGLTALEQ